MEPTRKERIEMERQARKESREKEIQMKKLKSALPKILIALVIIAGVVWLVKIAQTSSSTNPGELVADMGKNHINVGDEHEPYNSNPPTSGPHAQAVPLGYSADPYADENVIHNLEHGGIWITYKDLTQDQIDQLKTVANLNRGSVVVSPREANDSPVAVVSWNRIMKLDTVDLGKISEFIRKNKNKSPEPISR